MVFKILKILTIVSFLLITFDSGHIGGQFGTFLILGFYGEITGIVTSSLVIFTFILFILSSFFYFSKTLNLTILILSSAIFVLPILAHLYFLVLDSRNDLIFFISCLIFLIFYGFTLKKIKDSNSYFHKLR